MKIWAGIVTFNPNLERLKKNIDSIVKQVASVIVFDNGSENYQELENLSKRYANIMLIRSTENRGLAFGLNRICNKAFSCDVDWILLLDHDSVSEDNCIGAFLPYIDLPKAAILCPVMFDSRRRVNKPKSQESYKEVKECIQSGALYNVRIMQHLNYFDEWYFIDYIDYDYCCAVRRNGYKIFQINSLLLDQEASTIEPTFCHDFLINIAKKTRMDFFAKLSYRPAIKPWRSYYTARNRVYYIYKNKDVMNEYWERLKGVYSNIRNTIRIKEHFLTTKAILSGIRDGKKKVREMKNETFGGNCSV